MHAACPSDLTLAALAGRSLSQTRHEEVLRHVDGCSLCRRLAAAAVREHSEPGEPRGEVELRSGSVVGPYRLRRRLGSGASGVVFSADDLRLEREVALKFLAAAISDRGHIELLARHLREARAMAALQHPNVVEVYDVDSEHVPPYIAFELVAGSTLRRWLGARSRTRDEILDVFMQAGRGLAAVHALGLVHRDFKPSNAMVGRDGRVKLIDFGLASIGAEGSGPEGFAGGDDTATTLTGPGVVLGTPAYMAPEQLRGEAATPRADQYAFCVALFEALLRRRPFSGSTFDELRRNVLSGSVPTTEGVPTRIGRVLRRGLSHHAADRFPSMGALLQALGRARRPRPTLVVGALALLGLAGGVATAFVGREDAAEAAGFTGVVTRCPPFAAGDLDRGLDEARRLAEDGRHRAALDRLAALAPTARLCGRGAQARLELRRGEAFAATSEAEASARALEGAYFLALADDDPATASEALRTALEYAPAFSARTMVRWVRHAEALVTDDEATHVRLAAARAALALRNDDVRTAQHELEVAARFAADGGASARDLAAVERELARTRRRAGDVDAAIEIFRRAIERYRRALGPAHPVVADTLVDLGFALSVQHDDEARATFENALAIYRRTLGAETPRAASAHRGLARLLAEAGDFEAAIPALEAAREALRTVGGPDNASAATVASDLGVTEFSRGRPDRALPHHDEAIALLERGETRRPVLLGYAHLLRSTSRLHAGDPSGALADARRAHELIVPEVETPGVAAANAEGRLCEALVETGAWTEAIATCSAHLEMVDRLPGGLFTDRALILLAHARLESGDRDRARALTLRLLGEPDIGRPQLFELRPACRLATVWTAGGDARLGRALVARALRMYTPRSRDREQQATINHLLKGVAGPNQPLPAPLPPPRTNGS